MTNKKFVMTSSTWIILVTVQKKSSQSVVTMQEKEKERAKFGIEPTTAVPQVAVLYDTHMETYKPCWEQTLLYLANVIAKI